MKSEIQATLNEILNKVAKDTIINEVEEKELKKFPSLFPFIDNMTVTKNINGYDYIIEFNGLKVNDFINQCKGDNINDSIKKMEKKLLIDLDEKNNDVNLEIALDVENDEIKGKIKINQSKLGINENIKQNNMKRKKTMVLSETKLINMIQKIVESVPGLETFQKTNKISKKNNEDNIKTSTEKMKKYLSFDGNDNPKFPKQIGKGEKKAKRHTEKEDEYINNFRGENALDLDYDNSENQEFNERNEKYLKGSKETGNCQNEEETVNTIKSDTGEQMLKISKKRKEVNDKKPMYKKDPMPVTNKQNDEDSMLNEELKKMKNLYKYNKKTQ